MTALDRVLPTPRLVEVDHVDVAALPEAVWKRVRHDDLARGSALIRALFAARTLAAPDGIHLRIDDLSSTQQRPGFQVLVEDAPREVVVGAIGEVWQLEIPFVHVASPDAFACFHQAGFVKVAWALRVLPFTVQEALRTYPGDDLVGAPRWAWTHGVEIEAEPAAVWPWIAQIGADKGGFYSYQWLENLAGCNLRNAEAIHAEWEVKAGDGLRLHPDMPALRVVALERGRWFVAYAAPDDAAVATGKSWASASWLFYLEPLRDGRCRLISRYRATCSEDLRSRLAFGPTIVEPVGFTMDRRLLLQVKQRAESAHVAGPREHG